MNNKIDEASEPHCKHVIFLVIIICGETSLYGGRYIIPPLYLPVATTDVQRFEIQSITVSICNINYGNSGLNLNTTLTCPIVVILLELASVR